jgi:hypothetical protein
MSLVELRTRSARSGYHDDIGRLMQFRWAAAIALWTMLSGPIIGPPTNATPRAHENWPGASSSTLAASRHVR